MSRVEFSEVAIRFTPDEYEALAHDPEWADRRVELIHGVILEKGLRSELHEVTIDRLLRWLFATVDRERFTIRVASPLRTQGSEPEPDVMVFASDRPKGSLPRAAALVIEVAVTSIRRDTQIKPKIYAESVAEYWVVQPEAKTVTVHHDPADGAYRSVSTHDADTVLTPVALVLLEPLDLHALFALAQ